MPKSSDEIHGLLGKGTEFQGHLKFDGTVRIDGLYRGEIQTSGTLLIGEGARVEADVNCGTLIVNGEIQGDIKATNRVEALAPARIIGNVFSPVLVINEGVFFDGNSRMETPAEKGGEKERKIPFLGKREKRASNEELPLAPEPQAQDK
jgi:cytoskeletal protein CcmA (bactofilin family)